MNRVYLVSPSLQPDVQQHIKDNMYGLGLGYLHSVLERAGYNITTECHNNLDEKVDAEKLEENLRTLDPDFLLIQMFTMNRVSCYRTIRRAREIKPGIKIIVGGVHATILYEQLLNNFDIDFVVVGEGEVTVVELLNAIKDGSCTELIEGIAFRKNGVIVKTPERQLLVDLDLLPFPRHGLFMTPDREMACILTSRGCPFKCSFCCLHTISKRKFRVRSVINVIQEIEYIRDNFPQIREIQLADDTFTLDQKRAMDVCKEIIKRNIKLEFSCSARIKPASRELFELMEQAGFRTIKFGMETGSEKLLHSIHKNITRNDVIETFRMLKDSKMDVSTFQMVGFPGETAETVNETIDLVKKLQKIKYYEFVGVARLWVYPNTEVYELMKAAGKIDDNFWLTEENVPFYTVEHSEQELDKMVVKLSLACMTKRQIFKRVLNGCKNPLKSFKSLKNKARTVWNTVNSGK